MTRGEPPAHDLERLRAVLRDAPGASSDAARRTMLGNRRRDSTPELLLRRTLHAAGLRFRVDFPINVPGRRPIRPDVVFTRLRLAVFMDGCFWHGCPEHGRRPRTNSSYWSAKVAINRARDIEQTRALEAAGWRVLRIWEHESVAIAVPRVCELLARSGGERHGCADQRV